MSISPMVSFLGFLATFICFCVTVLLYHYLYFVVNKNKNVKIKKNGQVHVKYFSLLVFIHSKSSKKVIRFPK